MLVHSSTQAHCQACLIPSDGSRHARLRNMRGAMFFAAALWFAVARPHAAQFTPADPSRTDTKHLTITTSTSAPTAAAGDRLTLYVDVAPKSKMHVYAPDQTDYFPKELTGEPASSLRAQRIPSPSAEQS